MQNVSSVFDILVLAASHSKFVPFDYFFANVPLCQLVSQKQRLEMWLRFLCKLNAIEYPKSILLPHISDCFTMQSFFDSTPRHEACFAVPIREEQSDAQSYIVQQVCNRVDLDYEYIATKLPTFPFSVDFFCKLMASYHMPVRILSLIPYKTLYELLQNMNFNERYSGCFEVIGRQLMDTVLVSNLPSVC